MSDTEQLVMRKVSMALLCALVLLGATVVTAQPGTITRDPKAVPLRKIWEVRGNDGGGTRVGDGAGGLGDIFGSKYGAWAVHFGLLNQWRVYHADSTGTLSTTPVWISKPLGGGALVVGDFWGTRHKAVGFRSGSYDGSGTGSYYYELHVFRTDSNRLDTVESATLNTRTMNPVVETTGPDGIFAADIDGDGADDLVLGFAGLKRGGSFATGGEIWIFKGGPNFQLDTPTVIIRGPDLPGGQKTYALEDFDGDHQLDIVMMPNEGTVGNQSLYFLWGDGTLDGYNDATHHRIVKVADGDLDFTPVECDGDHITDIVLNRQVPATERGAYLFRSGTGKSARTRSYQTDDADLYFRGYATAWRGGYVNDTARRYELLWINTGVAALFNGGPNGPDVKYDAWINENTYAGATEIPDVDGDGWNDYIDGDQFINFEGGAAAIFAGGPYIPRDSSIAGVRDIAVAGVQQAVSVWPNPARDELHIAWRGDLQRMPRRFQVHDALGRNVADGDVVPGTSSVVWPCSQVPPGVYLVSIYDVANALITTARIVKQ